LCFGVLGVSGRGGAGAFGGLTGLVGVGGVGVGVLVGDPREQVGLAGEQCGVFGGVAAEGRRAVPGETVEELGDLAGGDRSGCRVVGGGGCGAGVLVSHRAPRVRALERRRGRRAGR
jgi:hypothetical protein